MWEDVSHFDGRRDVSPHLLPFTILGCNINVAFIESKKKIKNVSLLTE